MEAFATDIETGRTIHISNALKSKDYICKVCGTQLFPIMGTVKKRHFRHKSLKEHQHRINGETRLHREAKRILEFFKLVELPDQLGPAELEYVQLEKSHMRGPHRIRPDVTARVGSKEIFIEIKVAHAVSEYKRDRLLAFNIDTIEIDLSMYVGRTTLSEHDLQMAVIFDARRTFVHRRGIHLFPRLTSRLYHFWNKLRGLLKPRRPMKLHDRDPDSGQSYWNFG